ncbi:TPA: hypothetical protein DDW69_00140 [candidate division CPR2 bacterium]|uniref:Uncharacterized protein n=1 Tax=candidate division CPR2 bacterium GW2011_GWC1_41_48 TaxID=1618344 RepID=A0A0G0Z6T2_UNCC2|nr:MAG: hypothetical protein UT47_C0005G0039 [candidate division CPR2 bacterium GW2011_GWC2_39_35]KKR29457.1 MAG: hypothetical protein UT59_C0007G0011 [candidate division CPR2 bacterium GW2011_GWD1_39_7]KKS08728.1 MAG: hypothetical protein UU65_C0005G0039 [candidate division CPR2 bacterium GW2011_GWC1_41_48]OGB55616.1 MAG: hypothetical protein A2Y27_03210 [candidate division CPR2 bacterium GWD1_39_7]OGB72743.1 MAG: hypothetical protein A2Y26_04700 [candidate division CPR2 bacterium GWD2_39_7]H
MARIRDTNWIDYSEPRMRPENGKSWCDNCTISEGKCVNKRKDRAAERNKKAIEKANKEGLCTKCRKRPRLEFSTYCSECKNNDVEAKQNKRKKNKEDGICPICGCRKAKKDKKSCAVCLKKTREYDAFTYEYYLINGLCTRCGVNPKAYRKKKCHSCLKDQREKARASRSERPIITELQVSKIGVSRQC